MAELANRDQAEAEFAARISKLSDKHRQELLVLLGNPPDPSRVPEEFWRRVEEETQRELAILLLLLWGSAAVEHGLSSQAASSQAAEYATSRSTFVAQSYSSNSRELLARLEVQSAASPLTKAQVDEMVRGVFGPARAQGIAATETTHAATAGSEAAIDQTVGLSEDDTWFTRDDGRVCPVCEPLHEKPRSVWQRVAADGPPAHPHCRCWIRYARET